MFVQVTLERLRKYLDESKELTTKTLSEADTLANQWAIFGQQYQLIKDLHGKILSMVTEVVKIEVKWLNLIDESLIEKREKRKIFDDIVANQTTS